MFKVFSFSFLIDLIRGMFYACFVVNLKNKGIPFETIIFGYAIMQLCLSFFQPIAGVFADVKGKKTCTLVGATLYIFGLHLFAYDVGPYLAWAGFAIAGIGTTIFFCAKSTWLAACYENAHGATKRFFFTVDIFRRIGLGLGALLVAICKDPSHVWILTTALGTVALLIGLSIPNSNIYNHGASLQASLKIIKASLLEAKGNIFLIGILFAAGIYAIEAATRDSILQTYVHDILAKDNRYAMVYVQVGVGLVGIFGNLCHKFLSKSFSEKNLIITSLLTITVVEFLAGVWARELWQFLPLYWCGCLTLGWFYPLTEQLIYKVSQANVKTTIFGIKSMVEGIVQALACFALSYSLRGVTDVSPYWMIGSTAVLFCALIYSITFKAYERNLYSYKTA